MKTIVFSDVDGTLLNSQHEITPHTRAALDALHKIGVPFVIISARSPSGIYPIVEEYGLHCAIVSYSGALILDENRRVLAHRGMPKPLAAELLTFVEKLPYDLTWCVYSLWATHPPLKARIPTHTANNDHDGIAGALERIGLV